MFDGVCNVCAASVRFILANDKTESILFAPLQSEVGDRLMRQHGIDSADTDTFLYVSGGKAYIRSDAALEVARNFGFWRVLRILRWFPRAWRDACYASLASNRYRWFGKRDQCYLPTAKERDRFLIEEK
ncbi:thiol-disulfide oxidoreductase DCC family protein [Candidatus Marimicrobium litorale]|uniref:thiol-disulfide oxidoreductase DCC family protein n=1 Tax=Candidatus Marimicrobium litorale TaxID=2518991 RepID=UPI00242DF779|nr:DCC1-like thiol-disulfide oxidoreductase family protein [Candidatus Marimicrobium litorale]